MEAFDSKTRREFRKLLHATGWAVFDKTDGFLSHYTSTFGLMGILESQALWFTDSKFLNDSSEGEILWDIIDELYSTTNNYSFEFISALQQVKESQSIGLYKEENLVCEKYTYFVCSFSENPDSLTMWNYYTKSDNLSGYNLIFDKRNLLNSIVEKSEFTEYDFSLVRVVYEKEKQIECITRILDFFHSLWIKSRSKRRAYLICELYYLLQSICLGFKHHAYKDEREVRIVLKLTNDECAERLLQPSSEANAIQLRPVKNLFIPYIKLDINKETIKTLVVSPYIKDNLAISSVCALLDKNGLPNTKVRGSEIPVRY